MLTSKYNLIYSDFQPLIYIFKLAKISIPFYYFNIKLYSNKVKKTLQQQAIFNQIFHNITPSQIKYILSITNFYYYQKILSLNDLSNNLLTIYTKTYYIDNTNTVETKYNIIINKKINDTTLDISLQEQIIAYLTFFLLKNNIKHTGILYSNNIVNNKFYNELNSRLKNFGITLKIYIGNMNDNIQYSCHEQALIYTINQSPHNIHTMILDSNSSIQINRNNIIVSTLAPSKNHKNTQLFYYKYTLALRNIFLFELKYIQYFHLFDSLLKNIINLHQKI